MKKILKVACAFSFLCAGLTAFAGGTHVPGTVTVNPDNGNNQSTISGALSVRHNPNVTKGWIQAVDSPGLLTISGQDSTTNTSFSCIQLTRCMPMRW
jgi:hypothetical protein